VEIMAEEITEEEMMAVEETSKLAVGLQNDSYEFPLISCIHGFRIGGISRVEKLVGITNVLSPI
jgi:hypothetical protein